MHPIYRLIAPCIALLISAPACDDDSPSSGNDVNDTATQTDTRDGDADTADTARDTVELGDFGCGALLTCPTTSACASRGQGACIGPPPDAQGQCAPNCAPYECGGSEKCLCDTYWCEPLPADCHDCGCAPKPDPSCQCDDSDGQVHFSCVGA